MITIAVTGNVATGKSTFCQLLADTLKGPLASCDAIVHQLYESEKLLTQILDRFGSRVFEGKKLNRRALGELVFHDSSQRKWLEEALHPLVLEEVNQWKSSHLGSFAGVLEVPLLYEVDFPVKRDVDVVVACSPETQRKRLSERDQFDPVQAEARISAQLSIFDKIRRADLVIWNEGSHSALTRQSLLAAARITT